LNIGAKNAALLDEIGVADIFEYADATEDLFIKILSVKPDACLHLLYALEGAITQIKKSEIPKSRKEELKRFYASITVKHLNNRV
jgi:DNA transformation protein